MLLPGYDPQKGGISAAVRPGLVGMGVLLAALCLAGLPPALAQVGGEDVIQAAQGEQVVANEERVEDILKQLLPEAQQGAGFVYRREGRTDPFRPFISEKQVQGELAVEESKLSGMQLFEPGQLTLVGIVKVGPVAMAMVQDSAGKGYMVRQGTKLGRHGVVTDIAPNLVLVRELASFNARTKEKTYKTTKMVLKKEGVNE